MWGTLAMWLWFFNFLEPIDIDKLTLKIIISVIFHRAMSAGLLLRKSEILDLLIEIPRTGV